MLTIFGTCVVRDPSSKTDGNTYFDACKHKWRGIDKTNEHTEVCHQEEQHSHGIKPRTEFYNQSKRMSVSHGE